MNAPSHRPRDAADEALDRVRRDHPEAFEQAVSARLDRELLLRTRSVPLTAGGTALVFALSMVGRIEPGWLWTWLAAQLLSSVGRSAFAFHALSAGGAPSRAALNAVTGAAVVAGALWGAAPLLPLTAPDPGLVMYSAAVVAGVIAGTAVSYSTAPRIALAVALPALPPTALAAVLRGDAPGFGLALLAVVLGALVVLQAGRNRASVERDIAVRLLLEREKLRVQGRETLLRLGADALPQRIAYVDPEHRFVFVNRRYVDMLSMPRDKIIGRHLREVLGQQYPALADAVTATLAGSPRELELEHLPWLARDATLRVTLVPDVRDDGRVRGAFMVLDEVRRRAAN
jgi:PAS domain-containing protein